MGFLDPPVTPSRIGALAVGEESILITVGAGGDTMSMNEAIAEASRYMPLYRSDPNVEPYPHPRNRLEIRQLSGFEMAEQVFIQQLDYGFIEITSEDAVVPIVRSTIVQNNGRYGTPDNWLTTANNWRTGTFPVWCAQRMATLPYIRTLYEFDDSGDGIGTVGVLVFENSRASICAGGGVKGAGWRGLYADASHIYARNTIWDDSGFSGGPLSEDAGIGVRSSNQSVVDVRGASVQNCVAGVYVSGGYITASGINVSGAVTVEGADISGIGLSANNGAVVTAPSGPIADNCQKTGFDAHSGAHLNLGEAQALNCGTNALTVSDAIVFAPGIKLSATSGHAVQVNGGILDVNGSATSIKSTAGRGISMTLGSNVTAAGATIEGTGDYGVRSFGSIFTAPNAKIGGTLGDINLDSGSLLFASGATKLDGATAVGCNVRGSVVNPNGMRLGLDERFTYYNTDASVTLNTASTATEFFIVTATFTPSAGRSIIMYASTNFPWARHTFIHAGSGTPLRILQPDGTLIAGLQPGGAITLVPDNAGKWVVSARAKPETTSATTKSGTAYTLVYSDYGKTCEFTNASAVVVTVPLNSAVAFPIGAEIPLLQYGAGQVSIVGDTGVIIRAPGGANKIAAQYGSAVLRKRATDEWILGPAGGLTT